MIQSSTPGFCAWLTVLALWEIYNPDRGQGHYRQFLTRCVWPKGALAPGAKSGEMCVWRPILCQPLNGMQAWTVSNSPSQSSCVISFNCELLKEMGRDVCLKQCTPPVTVSFICSSFFSVAVEVFLFFFSIWRCLNLSTSVGYPGWP